MNTSDDRWTQHLQQQLWEARELLRLVYTNSMDMGEVFEVHHFPEVRILQFLAKTYGIQPGTEPHV